MRVDIKRAELETPRLGDTSDIRQVLVLSTGYISAQAGSHHSLKGKRSTLNDWAEWLASNISSFARFDVLLHSSRGFDCESSLSFG